jgi:CheY-like chemotaxis protein
MLLVIEDNPADIVLLKEALKQSPVPVQLCTVRDGREALSFSTTRAPTGGRPAQT